jgi:hypothetical protein
MASSSRSSSTVRAACAGSRSASRASVTTTATAVSPSMKASRCAGYAGSSGTYAPPAFSTASVATISSGERSRQSAARVPGSTPARRRWRASRFARASSSPYVIRPPSHASATASGVAAA